MEELRPCPFCGQKTAMVWAKKGRYGWFVFARCEMCGAESKKFGVESDAKLPKDETEFWEHNAVAPLRDKVVMLWNTRAGGENNDK